MEAPAVSPTAPRSVASSARRAVRRARITPELVWFVASARRREDPYPAYRRLRRLDGVHHSPLGVWVISRHAEVTGLLRDASLSSDERQVDLATLHIGPLVRLLGRQRDTDGHGPFYERLMELMLFRDPPDHTRLRGLVNKAFTPRTVQRLEERMETLAHQLLDQVAPAGSADFMATFAYPFPAMVICELIGVPRADIPRVVEQAPALAAGLDPGPLLTSEARAAADRATTDLSALITELIVQRRREPTDDLLSALLESRAGDVLSDDELIGTVLLLLIAGHETTANLLGNGMVALLAQPDRLRELLADPALQVGAPDELLRFDSPVQMTIRIATRPLDIDGHSIAPGSIVVLCTGAANHDEGVYEHPERLDWHRDHNPHLAFGGGIHYCLGAPLARAETRIALRAVLDRLPDLALAGPPVRRPSFTIRGLSSLPLQWSPRGQRPSGAR
jgi:cytochrome P450